MELFSIKIRRTFQLVSTGDTVISEGIGLIRDGMEIVAKTAPQEGEQ